MSNDMTTEGASGLDDGQCDRCDGSGHKRNAAQIIEDARRRSERGYAPPAHGWVWLTLKDITQLALYVKEMESPTQHGLCGAIDADWPSGGILPCPFCGNDDFSEGLYDINENIGGCYTPWYVVTCIKCNVQTHGYNDDEAAIAAWNRRVERGGCGECKATREALIATGVGGIMDEFRDPADAITQFALRVQQLEVREEGLREEREGLIGCVDVDRLTDLLCDDGMPFEEAVPFAKGMLRGEKAFPSGNNAPVVQKSHWSGQVELKPVDVKSTTT